MRLYRSAGKLARDYGVLLAALLVGAFLRVYGLGTENLWFDEGASLYFARLEGLWEIARRSRADNNLPLYYAILHYWVLLFGDSEFSLRLPAALAGTAVILAMYEVGRLVFDRGMGLAAALILALNPFHVEYSQEARVYSLMALLTLLSFYFFVKAVRGDRGLATSGAYLLCTSALMHAHVYGAFVVLAQNVHLAVTLLASGSREEVRARLKAWVPLQALLFVLYVPAIVFLLAGSLANPGSRWWIRTPSPDWAYFFARDYAGSAALAVILAVFSLVAIVALAKGGDEQKLSLLLAWLLIPTILPAAISLVSTPMFIPRYAIAASLALYPLAAKGIEVTVATLRERSGLRPAAVWLTAAAAVVLLSSAGLWRYFDAVENPRWDTLARYADAHARSGDVVAFEPGYRYLATIFDYYSGRADLERMMVGPADWGAVSGQYVAERDRVWAVRYYDTESFYHEGSEPKLLEGSFSGGSHAVVYRERYRGKNTSLSLDFYERRRQTE